MNCKKMIIFAKIIRFLESPLAKQLVALSQRIEALASQRDDALRRLKEAEEEIADLRRQLAQSSEEVHRQGLDIEFLTLSRKLADNPQALADARETVRGMLAKVEKAISLLKEDARI